MTDGELVGRDTEVAQVRTWVERVVDGPSTLLLRGEPGIGKSRLLAATVGAARELGLRVLETQPVEDELALGYVGLGDLLTRTFEEAAGALPEPQRAALAAALGLEASAEPADPMLVGRATTGALGNLSGKAPVVIAIDDAQWLDAASARALSFAVRRLGDARVSVVAALREPFPDPLGLAASGAGRHLELRVTGLERAAVGRLLRAHGHRDLSPRLVSEIHRRSNGNPLFALEIARVGDVDGLPASLRDLVHQRVTDVAPDALAAIELVAVLGPVPFDDLPDPAAVDGAVRAGILEERDGVVRFTHPLLAGDAYARIPPGERRELHRAAAANATQTEGRARHLALAATGPDAEVADLLDEAARLARARGAPETAVHLAREARRVTPPSSGAARLRRTMDEAEYLYLASDERGAANLVAQVLDEGAEGTTRVRALVQRALTTVDPDVAVASLEAAVAEPHDDPVLATRTLAQLAWQRGAWRGDVDPAVEEALAALSQARSRDDPATLVTTLTTAGLLLSLAGRPNAADHFREAVAILDRTPGGVGDHTVYVAYANERMWRGDFAIADAMLREERRLADAYGDEGAQLRLLVFGADLALRRGEWDTAAARLDAAEPESRDYWRGQVLQRRAILRARRGHATARDDAEELRRSALAVTDPIVVQVADFAAGVLDLAHGNLQDAAVRMAPLASLDGRAGARAAEFAIVIPETVAVLVEAGLVDEAATIARSLELRAPQLAPWGDAALALCDGLIAHASGRLDEALARLDVARTGFAALGAPWELGQALLAIGSVLRRAGRRRDAANALEEALAVLEPLGAEAAIRRARDELRRARPRPRRDDSLTDAERAVAALVAEGLTNREVAARLFTGVTTVEAHLTRIYAKLGIRSRTELARRVADGRLTLEPEGEHAPDA